MCEWKKIKREKSNSLQSKTQMSRVVSVWESFPLSSERFSIAFAEKNNIQEKVKHTTFDVAVVAYHIAL